jgi:hypothetical protein
MPLTPSVPTVVTLPGVALLKRTTCPPVVTP